MSSIQMQIAYEYPVIELPCAFIDHYMARCTPVYALIYIYSLRQCMGGALAVSSQQISQVFQILETDVVNALRYWENEGLIKLENDDGGMKLSFLSVKAPATDAVPEPPAAEEAEKTPRAHKAAGGGMGVVKPFAPSGRPQYTVEELTVFQRQSKDIERLFTLAEQSLGKMLTYHDMNLLFGFYDWLRLPVDVIGYMLSYCAQNDHRDLRYIEKVALDWAEKQIDDMEKALAYVQDFDRDYRDILRAMGLAAGFPSPSQRKYIDKWLKDYQMPTALAVEACDRAAAQIGKPKFAYVDKIMEGWNKKGIKTIEAAEADAQDFAKKKEESAKPPETKMVKNNKFINFKQRERDYAQLEKMEREYLAQRLKG